MVKLLSKPAWSLPECKATPEAVYQGRRAFLKAAGLGALTSLVPRMSLASAQRNLSYQLDRPITLEPLVLNNILFYEFGNSAEKILPLVKNLVTDPWTISVEGLVEKPFEIGFEDLIQQVNVEERLYRHRCVEAWAMAVPWTGFQLSDLLRIAKPLSSAKYVYFETFFEPEIAPRQNNAFFPWPYRDGLTIEEASNELAFIATGLYGKDLAKQNGAPIRLVIPWKYGFKSVKSIKKVIFTDERQEGFWEKFSPREYGFWANVNPDAPHLQWSQKTERVLGWKDAVPTQKFNGYGEFVGHLYDRPELSGEDLFH
ncbi:protein-methionine-sulfoxide reductase catalytic subunit MsrP [Alphaproteobacteria bacterium]|nr:protein-methionine-sulfoxide reductase catalytic subunit MsrP [Alphaproteobacteria bacterium]